jgi:hypothetical protein
MLSVQMLSGFQKTSAGATPLPTSMKGINACQFFQQHMAHRNTTVASGASRGLEEAKPLRQWFVSMTTPQEKNILLPLKAVASVGSVALISNLDPSARDAMRKFISQRYSASSMLVFPVRRVSSPGVWGGRAVTALTTSSPPLHPAPMRDNSNTWVSRPSCPCRIA